MSAKNVLPLVIPSAEKWSIHSSIKVLRNSAGFFIHNECRYKVYCSHEDWDENKAFISFTIGELLIVFL